MDAAAIQKSVAQLAEAFSQRMEAFEQQHSQCGPSPGDFTDEYTSFKSFVLMSMKTLQGQIALLTDQVDTAEMQKRRKILLLHGIPESSKEDTSIVVTSTVATHLKLYGFRLEDISRCHRMGRITSTDRPRPILFKLRNVTIRDKIWSSKTSLKGSGITLSEFLTKRRPDVFVAARQRFGVSRSWSRHGEVFVLGHHGIRHRVRSLTDLDEIVLEPVAKPKEKKTTSANSTEGSSKSKRKIVSKKP